MLYSFDTGNRLRSVSGSKGAYLYDGHGRRVLNTVNNVAKRSQYSNGGQLMYVSDARTNKVSDYVYLGGSLVAIREQSTAGGAFTNKYQHTDALGSPLAVTNQARATIETSEYEPYGKVANRADKDGPGFTGHVQDAATGMTYMQQRYYDPGIGLFLSIDPVTAYDNPVTNFCRYCYVLNNPYTFTDPDGRSTCVDEACKTSRIDHVVPRPNPQPPPVNGSEGINPTSQVGKNVGAGYVTAITFENDVPNGPSTDLPVTTATADMVEGAISSLGAQTNSTTGGHAGKLSNHNSGKAVDINSVDGVKIKSPEGGVSLARTIQDAGAAQKNIRENFGPAYTRKTYSPGAAPSTINNIRITNGHRDHVHLSGQE